MWEQIRSNRIRSAVLVTGMALILLFLGFFIGLAIGSWVVGLIIALLVWGIMTLIAFFQGDSIILSMAHAKKITPADNQRLFDVVEEMKIASALEKMPDVYIIDDPALNAFATGRDPNHSAIAITSGLLQILNRDELQGVIGHEISHIKNRDVRLMSLLTVLAWDNRYPGMVCMDVCLPWGGECTGDGEAFIISQQARSVAEVEMEGFKYSLL